MNSRGERILSPECGGWDFTLDQIVVCVLQLTMSH